MDLRDFSSRFRSEVSVAMAAALFGEPSVSSIETSGQNTLLSYLKFDLKWFGLFLLAGGFPFPPFSYLGFGGLNLWAAGSMKYFAMKAGLQTIITVGNMYLKAYFPHLWWVQYLLVLNPWYMFDLIQMFSPAFENEGFKVPLYHTPIGNGATGKMTPVLAAAVAGLLGTGIYGFMDILPPEIKVTYKPILNNIMLAVGATTAIAGGGIGTMMAIPKIMEAMRGNSAQASTALASLSSGPTPGPAIKQAGGGEENNNGIPSLGDVANDILNNQRGGGVKGVDYGSSIFLGILVLSALGGMSLALIRSKSVSSS
jgi:hypothetical protein